MPEAHQTTLATEKPLDYLVIGHLTADLTDAGIRLGGTATFSSLTAKALGLNTGVITSHADDLDTASLKFIWKLNHPSAVSTTFKNISDGVHRTQFLYQTAEILTSKDVIRFSKPPAIVHLGPVANEVDPNILSEFPDSLKCLTPQGWFRHTDGDHQVILQPWQNFETYLPMADIAVISLDDVEKDEGMISAMAAMIPIFVVTENYKGARVYWHNDARFINAPEVKYLNDTGAGDIFAASFFSRYLFTKDPWEAGRFAVLLASWSVTREYLESIPTEKEIEKAKTELIGY